MEEMRENVPWRSCDGQPDYFPESRKTALPAGKGELLLGALSVVFSLLLCNSLLFAGANLGFAAGLVGIMASSRLYLRCRGHRSDRYSASLFALCVMIAAAFPRTDDVSLKILMIYLLLVVPGMALCQTAGKNRRDPGGFLSLLDGPGAFFGFGFGKMSDSGRGLREAFRSTGSVGKNGGAVALGLLIAVPLLAVMIPLLMLADAAFEGLLDLLPDLELDEAFTTAILGIPLAFVLYTRTAALHHAPKKEKTAVSRKGLQVLTVNTVLIAVSVLYGVYLMSQLAYFAGGFSGILPDGYTLAQYARRGFFEMAWLCAINLCVISASVGLILEKTPVSTRVICLFLGMITLFLVAAASAKMFLYIGAYGLTRLRVLTEVFMLWLALTTVFVCVWLFHPKMPYMKPVLLAGLLLCAGLMWADVDAQIARYNVRAYQAGRLETVDMRHLAGLSAGAVPYIEELVSDPDPQIRETARDILVHYDLPDDSLRGWNSSVSRAREILEEYRVREAAEVS